MGGHRIQYSHPGKPLMAWNTRTSQGGMSRRRAAPMEAAAMANPTPETANQASLIGRRVASTPRHLP